MRLLHLYYDLMNLYGEYANVSALSRLLSSNGVEHTVDRMSLYDKPSLADYDFIYIGSGTEGAEKLALAHLAEYKAELKEYIESGKFLLLTGNSFEMLGTKITDKTGEYKGLELFDFSVSEGNRRLTGDAIFTLVDMILVGFVNKCSEIKGIATPLFKVKMGLGNCGEDKTEGLWYKNCFGTHLTGPILVKNPCFLKWLGEGLCQKELSLDAFCFEQKGYEITKRKLEERNGE